jgi:isoleucyl-tRNA synthetase
MACNHLLENGYVYCCLNITFYSTDCGITLSIFETSQNYKDVKLITITILFKTVHQDYEFEA